MNPLADTIAALATPPGEGGIAVIRVSGPDAITCVDRTFRAKAPLRTAATHTAHVGEIVDAENRILDQVVCLVFRAPHSYTGEETVEVSCHGGTFVSNRVLQAILAAGTRHARPGEFTQRAFLNGKMDLSQAEAVADLIHAHSDMAHRASIEQLRGSVLQSVDALRRQLMDAAGLIELELDFVDEGYEFKDKDVLRTQLTQTVARLEELASTYRYGRIWREGIHVVIAGSPNVGKSSLLNALLNADRAIVTDIPGTTRDFIDESINLDGITCRLTDTAGLRLTDDPVEREGVDRAVRLSDKADIVLFVLDQSRPIAEEEFTWLRKLIKEGGDFRRNAVIVLNKCDLPSAPPAKVEALLNSLPHLNVVRLSARTGKGVSDLKKAIAGLVQSGIAGKAPETVVVTNARHYQAIVQARSRLHLCLGSLEEGRSGEFIAVDLRAALENLGEIVGAVTTDDILNNIFARFCIGK